MRICFCLCLVLVANYLFAQKIIVSGQEGNRLLKWADFAGAPDNNSSFFAYTAYTTKFKYDDVQFNEDKAIFKGFEMTLEFDAKNSWVKKGKESDDLLKHEQGHFDVGVLYMQEVLVKINSAKFSRTGFQGQFRKLVGDIHLKYKELATQYDKETAHSTKKEEQDKWNIYFIEKLQR